MYVKVIRKIYIRGSIEFSVETFAFSLHSINRALLLEGLGTLGGSHGLRLNDSRILSH